MAVAAAAAAASAAAAAVVQQQQHLPSLSVPSRLRPACQCPARTSLTAVPPIIFSYATRCSPVLKAAHLVLVVWRPVVFAATRISRSVQCCLVVTSAVTTCVWLAPVLTSSVSPLRGRRRTWKETTTRGRGAGANATTLTARHVATSSSRARTKRRGTRMCSTFCENNV